MSRWRIAQACVAGSSHLAVGKPCEDSCFSAVQPRADGTESVVIVVCDGAGSASRGGAAADFTCQFLGRRLMDRLSASGMAPPDCKSLIADVLSARDALQLQSDDESVGRREWSCTLLVAVFDGASSHFAQVGDGAIAYESEGTHHLAFWPRSGEYHNETEFLVGVADESAIQVRTVFEPVSGLAVLTDGLQHLALDRAAARAHAPFFTPLHSGLRKVEAAAFEHQLACFLASEAVTRRTDDDKTLVIASMVE